MRIGFSANLTKPEAGEVLSRLVEEAKRQGVETVSVASPEALLTCEKPDLLAVAGGDGSILRYAAAAAKRQIPILGVNLGRVGFLAEVMPEAFPEALRRFIAGEYTTVHRHMLTARINGGEPFLCLNDVTIFKGSFGGATQLDITVDHHVMGRVFCDGMVVSTPTGSTAYNLSAGGSVLMGEPDVLAITAVCPHSLHVRPVVAPSGSIITMETLDTAVVTADGVRVGELGPSDRVTVTGADRACDFIRFEETDLFRLLREKLT